MHASYKWFYRDYIHVRGKLYFIHNQSPPESDYEELRKSFKLLSIIFKALIRKILQ